MVKSISSLFVSAMFSIFLANQYYFQTIFLAPTTKKEEKPYMQRTGGSWDGKDLGGKQGVGQGAAANYTELDKKYEELEKQGKLSSAPWAKNLPWTNEAAQQLAAKKPANTNNSSPKDVNKNSKATNTAAKSEEPPKKKGIFGW